MNEVLFGGRLRGVQLLSRLLPLAALSIACGGASTVDAPRDQETSAAGGQADQQAGAGGAAATGGHAGSDGRGGTAGRSGAAGSGGMGGSGASAGLGGAGAGAGGAGAGGSNGGSAGMGLAGSSGSSGVCHAPPPLICGGGPITLPKTCVSQDLASVGTSLPLGTCRTMCESMFTFSCSVFAVQGPSLTVQCSTGCPGSEH